jgi:hypothetical protein
LASGCGELDIAKPCFRVCGTSLSARVYIDKAIFWP